MNAAVQQVLQSALALPGSDRASIAASLIRSLDEVNEEHAEAAWAKEIQQRLEAIDNGNVELIPWDDVLGEMRGRGHG